MERFKDRIHIQKYQAYEFLQRPNNHIARHSRNKGEKAYICRCMPVIRISKTTSLLLPSKRVKSTNFQKRSKYTLKF